MGFIAPLLRHMVFGTPLMPKALEMAFELLTYGTVAGLVYGRSKWKCIFSLYRSLLIAMVSGRLVWAAVRIVMMGVASVPFSWQIFISTAFITAVPGIAIQLTLIPAIMVALAKAKLVPFTKKPLYKKSSRNT